MSDPDGYPLPGTGRIEPPVADELIALGIGEDLGTDGGVCRPGEIVGGILLRNDPTTAATIPSRTTFAGRIVVRQAGVVAGLPYAARAWELLAELADHPGRVVVTAHAAEGAHVSAGFSLATVEGPAELVLAGERTALDFLMVLSGIATEAARWQSSANAASRGRLRVTDTRKTVPGLRALSKYAVMLGGATNHRQGLWDMVLIKDNHLRCAGSVSSAVAAARAARPDLDIEVEADTLDQAAEAAAAGADIVLLDNMDDATLAVAVDVVRHAAADARRTCLTEASGNITFERLPALAAAGVDRVSTSALTLAKPLDVGLDGGVEGP